MRYIGEKRGKNMNPYDELRGPDQACADTIDGDASTQAALYEELKQYNLTDECVSGCDFFKVDSIDGIDFYHPNDETWGAIVAVSHEHKLALYTCFYEMDDMASPAPYDDYKMVVVDGLMGCKFSFEAAA